MTTYSTDEIADRIAIIDQALASSRRGFSRYGWVFVLWGCGHLAALTWEQVQPHLPWVWPITMLLCAAVMVLGKRALGYGAAEGTGAVSPLSRAIGSLWLAFGCSMFVIFFCDHHRPWPAFFLLLGMTNLANGLAVRWTLQCLVGILWLVAAGYTNLDQDPLHSRLVFGAMALLGEVAFGLRLVVLQRRQAHDR